MSNKTNKSIKVRDLKPSKDAKGGGGAHTLGSHTLGSQTAGAHSLGSQTAGSHSAGVTKQHHHGSHGGN
jgi:hypothetical protein